MNKKLITFLTTFLLSIVVIWLTVEGWALRQFLTQPISSFSEDKVVKISKGMSSRGVANLLYNEEIVHHPDWFVWYLKYLGKSNQLKAGEYRIEVGSTLDDLVEILVEGKTVTYPITFIAGEKISDAILKIRNSEKLDHKLSEDWQSQLKKLLSLKNSLEGQLLPETYFYSTDDSDLEVIIRAHQALQNVLREAWQNREKGLPIKTPYEALILASIVEKETGHAPERPMIAGVFINRLRKGMRLQSDPTVIYGIGDRYDGNIRKKDLQTKTPYNTYRVNGLPPSPIALASADAIRAVMNPAKTDALYFVANGDGQHRFSKTLEEHNRAVRDYLKKLNQLN